MSALPCFHQVTFQPHAQSFAVHASVLNSMKTRLSSLWERKRNVCGSLRALGITRATCSNYDVLLAIDHVRAGRSVAGKREIALPEQLAGLRVKRAQFAVKHRGADEQHASCSNNGPPVVFRSGISHAVCGEFRIVAERNLPKILARVQIDRVERASRRRDCGIAVRIEEPAVAGTAVFRHGGR
jgi:hypothetical protein